MVWLLGHLAPSHDRRGSRSLSAVRAGSDGVLLAAAERVEGKKYTDADEPFVYLERFCFDVNGQQRGTARAGTRGGARQLDVTSFQLQLTCARYPIVLFRGVCRWSCGH